MQGLFDVEKQEDTKYSKYAGAPQYQPIRDTAPLIAELYNNEKTNQLLQEIRQSDVSEEEKEFLRLAAFRHLRFNYANIAEYYCHASKEMQELMEKSALVIIDIDDAIANGYAKLSKQLDEVVEKNKNV